MSSASRFHDLVSGRRTGAGADLLRGLLRIGESFYSLGIGLRNRRYDRRAATIHRVGVPVVSVGNLTLGGTGKTPLVGWIARWFLRHGIRPAVVSRGYGAKRGGKNDEAMELARLLPGVPHIQNPDRVSAARSAILDHQAGVIVLDDAFQHRRIHRDLDIVLLDALEPFGYGRVFPRGTLREPVEQLRRADLIVLSRADHFDSSARASFWETVRRHAPDADCAEAIHAPCRLTSTSGEHAPLETMRDRPVAAFCGIGNPAGFRKTLDALGCRVIGFREFPDHYQYAQPDLDRLMDWAKRLGASAVLCTGKDLVKLPAERQNDLPLHAIEIELRFLTGENRLESRLHGICPGDAGA